MRTVTRVLAALVVVVTMALGLPPTAPAGAVTGDDEWEFLRLVNQERAAEGLRSLGFVNAAHEVSEDWSNQMRSRGTLAHRPGHEQRTLIERFAPNWRRLGENVGYGFSVSSLHRAFMDSPGHRANVLGDYTHLGIGSVTEPNGRIWVTFNFINTTDRLETVGDPNPAPAPNPPPLADTTRFNPLSPARILDTRNGTGYAGGRPGAGQVVSLRVTGAGGVPSDPSRVRAVALNVTVTGTAGGGYVTVWPNGEPRPLASNLNFQRANQTIANQVIAAVGPDGRVNLYPSAGTHLIADVTGWFEPVANSRHGRFADVSPARLYDSRRDETARPSAGRTTTVPVLGRGGVPSFGVSAVALNLTVTGSGSGGYVTAWGDGSRPLASNLNTEQAGQTIANQVIVPVGRDGSIRLFNSMPTHLIVDVTGWFTDLSGATADSGLFVPVTPYRAVDTRDYNMRSRYAAEWDLELRGSGWRAAALNVTIVHSGGGGYVTVWGGGARPGTSTVNTDRPGQIIPNAATVNGAGDSAIRVFTATESHIVIDVNGFYTS